MGEALRSHNLEIKKYFNFNNMVKEIKEQPISPEQIPAQGVESQIEQPVSPEKKVTEAQIFSP